MLNIHKKKLISATALVFILLIQGCATQSVKLTDQGRAELKNLDNIKVVHQSAGWPSLNTAAGVLASDLTFGMSEDWTAGHKLAKKFNIEDPGLKVKEEFLDQIGRMNVANFVNDTQPLTYENNAPEKMKAIYGEGVVLKVSPNIWQIWYYPFNWARYQMWFGASAELVRLEDAKVLWNGACRADQKDDATAPTFAELTGDGSIVLQEWVQDSAEKCASQLIDNFMGKI